ncbi:MAG: hypothetical protein FJZ86_07450 [Chloroflexi bacterium]|nr:hypothetical protein [Chloroflexota bacterium]
MTKRKTDSTHKENLDAIEAHLAGTLKPVTAPNDIVQRLRARIQMPSRREIALRLTDWRRLFFVFGGVMSGLLVLVTIVRMFYYLSGRKDTM